MIAEWTIELDVQRNDILALRWRLIFCFAASHVAILCGNSVKVEGVCANSDVFTKTYTNKVASFAHFDISKCRNATIWRQKSPNLQQPWHFNDDDELVT